MTNGAMSGALQGASAGAALGPWGAAGGAVLGGIGGALSSRSKKKAAQKRLKNLKKALQMFQAGSTDALGNKLSGNSDGSWKYDLNYGGQQAAKGANRANIALGSTPNKSRSEILRDTLSSDNYANTLTARANQTAAMRSGLRSGSNLGTIANAFGRQGSQNLRNAYRNAQKSAKNDAIYNANMRSQLANTATSASNPINTIQNNLRNMVMSLNKTGMDQQNMIAGAASNPYLNGQELADFFNIGGVTSQDMNNLANLQFISPKVTSRGGSFSSGMSF